MVDMFERHREQCSLSRKIDCQAVTVLLGTWVCLNIYSLIWLVYMRHRTTRSLRNRLHLGRTLQGGVEEDAMQWESSPSDAFGSTGSSDSLGSFGSWTCRFQRCFGPCYNRSTVCLAKLCSTFCRMLCACFFLARSAVTCFQIAAPEAHDGTEGPSHYSHAPDRSPPSSVPDNTRLRPRPRPLDVCGTLGCSTASSSRAPLPGLYASGSTPSSTSSFQQRVRARTCPSTPTIGTGLAVSAQPLPSPTSSAKGSPHGTSPKMVTSPKTIIGRNYSHLSE